MFKEKILNVDDWIFVFYLNNLFDMERFSPGEFGYVQESKNKRN